VHVLRVYHAGRDAAHRARERALSALGIEVTLVVPSSWPDAGSESHLTPESFRIIELDVVRAGDVNRHRYRDREELTRLLAEIRPDVLDLHEEPVSLSARQWLHAAGPDLPVTMYTAQNVDKRFPPPFAQYEAAALRRVRALYPCSRQAASVARGKGFSGLIEVLPLGCNPACSPGAQNASDPEVRLGLIGRLVPEKGVLDAVHVLARLLAERPARLVIAGQGPEEPHARALSEALGIEAAVDFRPWLPAEELAGLYRDLHVVLVPSKSTDTWVEQFGRIIVEAQASGAVIAGYASGAIPQVGAPASILVPEGDIDALSAAVTGVLTEPGRFRRVRDAGLECATQYSWHSVAERQRELYERVLAEPRSRRTPAAGAQERRRRAIEEFGETASLRGGQRRPFAAPVLRRDTAVSRLLGAAIDATAGRIPRF
jgi:glycosyltransferase involved in cell wall biosynthesis